jgi:hypothetical protein
MSGGHQASSSKGMGLPPRCSPKLLRGSSSAPPLPARALMRIGSVQPSAGQAGQAGRKVGDSVDWQRRGQAGAQTADCTGHTAEGRDTRMYCIVSEVCSPGRRDGCGAVLRTRRSRTACSVLASVAVPGAVVVGGGAGSPASAPAQGHEGSHSVQQHTAQQQKALACCGHRDAV